MSAERSFNIVRVQNIVWFDSGLSRADLSRQTALSRSTVSLVIKELKKNNLVVESHVAKSSGGRPPIALRFNYNAYQIIGIDLGSAHITVAAYNLKGKVLHQEHTECNVIGEPEQALIQLRLMIQTCKNASAAQNLPLLGIGLGVPCPVHHLQQHHLDPDIMPAWKNIDLHDELQNVFQVPVFVDNDANLGALAESWYGASKGLQDFAFVKIATGVGAGFVSKGQILRGSQGLAGEIGHIAIERVGPICRCGRAGCLEAWIGREALVTRYNQLANGQKIASLQELQDLYDAREMLALEVMDKAIEHLARALSNVVFSLNPAKITLWGPLFTNESLTLQKLQTKLNQYCNRQGEATIHLASSQLDAQAISLGAHAMVLLQALKHPHLQLQQEQRFPLFYSNHNPIHAGDANV